MDVQSKALPNFMCQLFERLATSAYFTAAIIGVLLRPKPESLRVDPPVRCEPCRANSQVGRMFVATVRVLDYAQASRGGFCRRVVPLHDDVCCNGRARSEGETSSAIRTLSHRNLRGQVVGAYVRCGFLTTRKSSRLLPSDSAASRWVFLLRRPRQV